MNSISLAAYKFIDLSRINLIASRYYCLILTRLYYQEASVRKNDMFGIVISSKLELEALNSFRNVTFWDRAANGKS